MLQFCMSCWRGEKLRNSHEWTHRCSWLTASPREGPQLSDCEQSSQANRNFWLVNTVNNILEILAKTLIYEVSNILFLINKVALAMSFMDLQFYVQQEKEKEKKTEQCWSVCLHWLAGGSHCWNNVVQ